MKGPFGPNYPSNPAFQAFVQQTQQQRIDMMGYAWLKERQALRNRPLGKFGKITPSSRLLGVMDPSPGKPKPILGTRRLSAFERFTGKPLPGRPALTPGKLKPMLGKRRPSAFELLTGKPLPSRPGSKPLKRP